MCRQRILFRPSTYLHLYNEKTICVSLEMGKRRVSVTSSLSLITLSIFVPTPLQPLLLQPNVSYIVLPKSRSAVHIYKAVYARKGGRLLQSEMETKEWAEFGLSSCTEFCYGWRFPRSRGIAICELNRDKTTCLYCLFSRKKYRILTCMITCIIESEMQILKCLI